MRKMALLVAAVMLVTLPASPALAHPEAKAHFHAKDLPRGCPKGWMVNAAGTTCTNVKTGEWRPVYPAYDRVPKRNYTCPELWRLKKDGETCTKNHKAISQIQRLNR